MVAARLPDNEEYRQIVLDSLAIVETMPDKVLDDLTLLAKDICNTKVSLVSLVDRNRQWFKSKHGLEAEETSREVAFCAHAILEDEVLEVPDALKDERFKDNALVTGDPKIRFYAGAPLIVEKGVRIGTLCVIDFKPMKLNEKQKQSLKMLSGLVTNFIKTRKKEILLKTEFQEQKESIFKLYRMNEVKNKVFHAFLHDFKSPIRHLEYFFGAFLEDNEDSLPANSLKDFRERNSLLFNKLKDTINQYVNKYENLHAGHKNELIKVRESIISLVFLMSKNNLIIKYSLEQERVEVNSFLFNQVFRNLLDNCIKYGNQNECKVLISNYIENEKLYFSLEDNGPGIAKDNLEKLFNSDERLGQTGSATPGSGNGLYLVKYLIQEVGGEIFAESDGKTSTKFIFNLG